MPRQSISDSYRSPNDELTAIDPSDSGAIESLFRRTVREGEQELMLAVLEDAINSFQSYLVAGNEKERSQFQEVQQWIQGKNQDWLFSFDNICETLGLDPSYVRRGLMAWAKRNGHSIELERRQRERPNVPASYNWSLPLPEPQENLERSRLALKIARALKRAFGPE